MRIQHLIMAGAVALAACGSKPQQNTTAAPPKDAKLYDRLGGKDAIDAVVNDFVSEVAADNRINAAFANADVPHLKQMLVEQICEASGGPCKYTGKDMKTVHQGMNIKQSDFDALVEDLKKSLDKFHLQPKEQQDLLNLLAPMKGDIVTAQ